MQWLKKDNVELGWHLTSYRVLDIS